MLCSCHLSQLRRPIRSRLAEQCVQPRGVVFDLAYISGTLLHGVIELREENFFIGGCGRVNPQAKIARRAGFDSFIFLVAWRIWRDVW